MCRPGGRAIGRRLWRARGIRWARARHPGAVSRFLPPALGRRVGWRRLLSAALVRSVQSVPATPADLRIIKAAGAGGAQAGHAGADRDRAGHRRLARRLARFWPRRGLHRHAAGRHRPQDPAVFRPGALRAARRFAGLVAGGEGGAGGRKAERHRRHARPQRSLGAARTRAGGKKRNAAGAAEAPTPRRRMPTSRRAPAATRRAARRRPRAAITSFIPTSGASFTRSASTR